MAPNVLSRIKVSELYVSELGAIGSYTAATWITLIIPCPPNLISFFHDDEIASVSFANHLNGSGHPREACANDQNISSVRIPAIVDSGYGIRVGHSDSSRRMRRDWG